MNFEVRDVPLATLPDFIDKAEIIAGDLKSYSPEKLANQLDISPRLAELNADRFAEWEKDAHNTRGKAAIMVYNGDVYQGLQAETLSNDELAIAQKHLRIITGLYGILRPLDLILPYRLEMGTPLKVGRSKDLYNYWQQDVTAHLLDAMKHAQTDVLVNLASDEYFKVIDKKRLKAKVITPVFKDHKNGQYKMISFFAKKARGMMSRFIIRQAITNPEDIKLFNEEGYLFNDQYSDESKWVFTRG